MSNLNLPQEWQIVDDYSSHRPLLFVALENTEGRVMELGCGEGSTPPLRKYCEAKGRRFVSVETNKEYAKKYDSDWAQSYRGNLDGLFLQAMKGTVGLLFIDCAPAEERAPLIELLSEVADVIVTHDTEPGAEWCYKMSPILNTFKYRIDYKPEGKPWATAVSNKIDVSKWKI